MEKNENNNTNESNEFFYLSQCHKVCEVLEIILQQALLILIHNPKSHTHLPFKRFQLPSITHPHLITHAIQKPLDKKKDLSSGYERE
jgi:hypothetical protein